jgi:hypothetical protein
MRGQISIPLLNGFLAPVCQALLLRTWDLIQNEVAAAPAIRRSVKNKKSRCNLTVCRIDQNAEERRPDSRISSVRLRTQSEVTPPLGDTLI